MKSSNFPLELFVNILSTADKSDTTHSKSMSVDGFLSSSPHSWVVSEAKVVISAEVQYFLAINHDLYILRTTNHTLNFVSSSFLDISNGSFADLSQLYETLDKP
jgi:hypothetical protein